MFRGRTTVKNVSISKILIFSPISDAVLKIPCRIRDSQPQIHCRLYYPLIMLKPAQNHNFTRYCSQIHRIYAGICLQQHRGVQKCISGHSLISLQQAFRTRISEFGSFIGRMMVSTAFRKFFRVKLLSKCYLIKYNTMLSV